MIFYFKIKTKTSEIVSIFRKKNHVYIFDKTIQVGNIIKIGDEFEPRSIQDKKSIYFLKLTKALSQIYNIEGINAKET